MDTNANTGFSASDAVLWGAMNNMGRGGYGGGGAWGSGYGYGGFAPFAGPASNAVRINRNAEVNREQNRCTQFALDQAEESRRFSDLTRQISNSELRNGDRLRDLERELNANARTAADCCCETQKEILRLEGNNNARFAALEKQACEDKAQILAAIQATETRALERDLNRAERREQTQTILSTCGCGCGGGVRPCPPVG